MQFGEIIKKRRLLKGYTQTDMERLTGLKPSNLSQLENGKRGDAVNLKTIQTFAKALGLTFIITPDEHEDIKAIDTFKEVEIYSTEYSKDDKDFINDPTSQEYILIAKTAKELKNNGGFYSRIVKDLIVKAFKLSTDVDIEKFCNSLGYYKKEQ